MSTAIELRTHAMALSPAMARARHSGRKRVTRRIVGPANTLVDGRGISAARWSALQLDLAKAFADLGPSPAGNPGPYLKATSRADPRENIMHRLYPRIMPGDRIRWKETWQITAWDHEDRYLALAYPSTPSAPRRSITLDDDIDPDGDIYERYWEQCSTDMHKAGIPSDANGDFIIPEGSPIPTRKRPGRFMPSWAARYVDPVTDVRLERITDITQEQCIAEGVMGLAPADLGGDPAQWPPHGSSPITIFQALWESINGPGSFSPNVWVWVIQFDHAPLQA